MNKSTVYRVDRVTVAVSAGQPPRLSVTARGTAPTPGWTKPELTPYVYVTPPADGIWEFGFIAEPPTDDFTLPVVTPIPEPAIYRIENPESWVRGVRVHASSNAKEAFIGEISDGDHKICVKGTLTDEGVECQVLRAEDGELYTLVGDLKEFKIGDVVYVLGTIVPISFCMQGITIAVEWISKKAPKCG